jgi:hypothetical protein
MRSDPHPYTSKRPFQISVPAAKNADCRASTTTNRASNLLALKDSRTIESEHHLLV